MYNAGMSIVTHMHTNGPAEEAALGLGLQGHTEGFLEPMCFIITKWEIYYITKQLLWFLKITWYRQSEWEFTNLFQI